MLKLVDRAWPAARGEDAPTGHGGLEVGSASRKVHSTAVCELEALYRDSFTPHGLSERCIALKGIHMIFCAER